jgi:hypothetical protein
VATTTYTPNLRLKISSDLSADAKYNLGVIDYMAGKLDIAVSGDTKLRSSTHITIEADSPSVAGGTGTGQGNLTVGASNNKINYVSFYATTVDYHGAPLLNVALPEKNISIGDTSGISTNVDTSVLGDIEASTTDGLQIKAGVVGDTEISDVTMPKVTGLSAALQLKADLSYVDSELAERDLAIAQVQSNLSNHEGQQNNPHLTTATQVGAYTKNETDSLLSYKVDSVTFNAHLVDLTNPHEVTAAQVGAYTKDEVDSIIGGLGGGQILVSAADVVPGYLDGKLVAGTGTSLTKSAGEILTVANTDPGSSAVNSHESTFTHSNIAKVKVSPTDDVAGYLNNKLSFSNLDVTVISDPDTHFEIISVENNDTGSAAISTHENTYAHGDIAHTNRSDLDNVSGTNTGDEDKTSIETKLGAATTDNSGYLTSDDWDTFSGKQDALGFTPVNKAGDTLTGLLNIDNEGLQFDIAGSPTAPTEGRVYWDLNDHTLAIKPDIANCTLQVGQEQWVRVRNQTGSLIQDASVVYISGSTGFRPQITKAQANTDVAADKTIGLVTADISHSSDGFVTVNGLIHDVNTSIDAAGTSLSDGDTLYLSATTAGGWVKTKPTYPNVAIQIGHVVKAHNSQGIILVDILHGAHLSELHDTSLSAPSDGQVLKHDGSKWVNAQLSHTSLSDIGTNTHAAIDTFIANKVAASAATLEPTGYEDPANIVITYDSNTTQTITLTHSSGTIAYWIANTRYTRVSPYTTPPHPGTPGQSYFFTFAAGNVPTWTTSFPGFSNNAYTAYVYYGATDKFAIRECHGLMQWEAHQNLHNNIGTYRTSGATVAGLSGGGSNQTDMQPTVTAATVMDEDLPSTIPAIASKGTYMRAYVNTGVLTFSSGANIFFDDATNPQYNANPASGTALVSITANNIYFNVYGILVPATSDAGSQAYRILWLTGQATYTSLALAQAEDFRTLNLGNLSTLFTEFVPYIRISLYRSSGGYRNTRAGGATATSAVTYLAGSKAAYTNVSGSISNSTAVRYSEALTWSGAGPYTHTCAGATHLKGTEPIIQVFVNTSGSIYQLVIGPDIDVDATTGDITITSSENFVGKILIL